MSVLILSDRYDRRTVEALMKKEKASVCIQCSREDGVPPKVLGEAICEALENGFFRLIHGETEYCLCPGSFLSDFRQAVLSYRSRNLYNRLPISGKAKVVRVVCAAAGDTWLYQVGDHALYLLPGYREQEITAVVCDGSGAKIL